MSLALLEGRTRDKARGAGCELARGTSAAPAGGALPRPAGAGARFRDG
jgi:hypothetical protein